MAIDRRKVTMISFSADTSGNPLKHEATDYVAVDHIDAYVADAETRWQSVSVSDETDHGPAGEDGDYNIPAHLA